MGRKLRTTLPTLPSNLDPGLDFLNDFRKSDNELQ